jgi:hypothetical protein
LFGFQVYFLTLTLSDENLSTVNRDLNKFVTFLRTRFKRAGVQFWYTWVVELQKRRYKKSGKAALHWHFAIVCPVGSLPDVCFRQKIKPHYLLKQDGAVVSQADLFARWGKGQVFCMKAYSNKVYGYLSKYFTKEYEKLEGYNLTWSSLRRWGSSQLTYYRFPEWGFDEVMKAAESEPSILDMWIKKEGARINVYCQEKFAWSDGSEHTRFVRVRSFRSPWERAFDPPSSDGANPGSVSGGSVSGGSAAGDSAQR